MHETCVPAADCGILPRQPESQEVFPCILPLVAAVAS